MAIIDHMTDDDMKLIAEACDLLLSGLEDYMTYPMMATLAKLQAEVHTAGMV